MSGARATTVIATFYLALAFVAAIERSCDVFMYVPGYDRCTIPPRSELWLFLSLAILPSFFLPLREQVSTGIIWTVYYLHIFGTVAATPYFSNNSYPYRSFAFWVTMSFLATSFLASRTNLFMPNLSLSSKRFYKVYLVVIALFFFYVFLNFPVSFKLASIYEVYDVREMFVESLGVSVSSLDTYMLLISGYAIAPVSIVIGLVTFQTNRIVSMMSLAIGILIVVFVYSVAAFKSVAFMLAFVAIIYFVVRTTNTVRGVIFFLATVAVGCLLLGMSGISETALIHWFRRTFIVPGINVQFYLQAFGLDNTTYVRDAPEIISRDFFGTNGSANSGLYGNGIARGGMFGILIGLAIFYSILVVIDAVTKNVPLAISVPVMFPVGYALANSATTAVFLTYGAAVSIVLMYLLSCMLSERDTSPGIVGFRPKVA